MITTLVLLGQVLELKARSRTSSALRELLNLAPPIAHRLQNNIEENISLGEVQVGDFLRVRPGEKVPVDGVVIQGATARMNPWFQESPCRFENKPVIA